MKQESSKLKLEREKLEADKVLISQDVSPGGAGGQEGILMEVAQKHGVDLSNVDLSSLDLTTSVNGNVLAAAGLQDEGTQKIIQEEVIKKVVSHISFNF